MTNALDLDALDNVAKAATPGPWTTEKPKLDGDGWPIGVAVAATPGKQMIYANPHGGSYPAADCRFIATFDPPIVLALIERVRAAEAETLEQARLNGMGAERELALMARIKELERAMDASLEAECAGETFGTVSGPGR